jgi:hypothetical protein
MVYTGNRTALARKNQKKTCFDQSDTMYPVYWRQYALYLQPQFVKIS